MDEEGAGGVTLGVAKAGGSVVGTTTDAAKDEALAKSRHSDPAVGYSEPLPGTRMRDLTKSPTSCGATILTPCLAGWEKSTAVLARLLPSHLLEKKGGRESLNDSATASHPFFFFF